MKSAASKFLTSLALGFDGTTDILPTTSFAALSAEMCSISYRLHFCVVVNKLIGCWTQPRFEFCDLFSSSYVIKRKHWKRVLFWGWWQLLIKEIGGCLFLIMGMVRRLPLHGTCSWSFSIPLTAFFPSRVLYCFSFMDFRNAIASSARVKSNVWMYHGALSSSPQKGPITVLDQIK